MGSATVANKNNTITPKTNSNIPKELIMYSMYKRRDYPGMGFPLVD